MNKSALGSKTRAHTICIVDDDTAVRDSLAYLLRAYDFRVKTHASGTDLLADPSLNRYACIVLDIHMPMLDGLRVLRIVGRRSPGLPVILITGLVDPSLAEDARLAGAAAMLFKPLDSEEFLAAIDHVRDNLRPARPAA